MARRLTREAAGNAPAMSPETPEDRLDEATQQAEGDADRMEDRVEQLDEDIDQARKDIDAAEEDASGGVI